MLESRNDRFNPTNSVQFSLDFFDKIYVVVIIGILVKCKITEKRYSLNTNDKLYFKTVQKSDWSLIVLMRVLHRKDIVFCRTINLILVSHEK